MKALLLLLIVIFFLSNIAFTQSKKSLANETSAMKDFFGTWILTTVSQQDTSIDVPVSEATFLIYKADGSYSDSSNRFKVSHGTWFYNRKTQFLYTNEVGGKTKLKVVRVTEDELILKLEEQGITITSIYRKVE